MDPTVQRIKHRRASRACSICHARKVKCDVLAVGNPCSNCRLDGVACSVEPRKKRIRKAPPPQSKPSPVNAHHDAIGPRTPATLGSTPDDREFRYPSQTPRSLNAPTPHPVEPQASIMPSPSSPTLSEHMILHQVPHYPFLMDFARARQRPSGEPLRFHMGAGANNDSTTHHDSRCSSEDLMMLKHRGAFDLPSKSIMDELIAAYFNFFHPFFPIVDKQDFLRGYDSMTGQQTGGAQKPSLLLLQTVLFTASGIVDMQVLKNAGFTSRKEARARLHKRARDLYNFDYELNSIPSIQALLLMSHYYPSMVEQKHTWHWVHQAISQSQTIGLHRDSGKGPQKKLWTRIWWACVVRDRLVSLGAGRPMHVHSRDCSTPMLTLEDVMEPNDRGEEHDVKVMFVEFVKLCQCMEDILTLQSPSVAKSGELSEQVTACDRVLQNWFDHLPTEALYPQPRTSGSPMMHGIVTLYRAVLHQIYNTAKIVLHQSQISPGRVEYKQTQKDSQQKVKAAALETTKLATELVTLGLVKYCPTISVTAVLPPLIVHLLGMRSATTPASRQLHQNRYDLCMMFLRELTDIYWHASFYCEFFALAADIATRTPQRQDESRIPGPSASGASDPLIAVLRQRMSGGRDSRDSTRAPEQSPSTSQMSPPLVNFSPRPRTQYSDGPQPLPPSPFATVVTPTGGLADPLAPQQQAAMQYLQPEDAAVMMPGWNGGVDSDLFGFGTAGQDFQLEEWLGMWGNFQNVFPSA